jgi:hypothetical protein
VLCAGLVLLGFITTSIVGACIRRTKDEAATALHLNQPKSSSSRTDVEVRAGPWC